MTESIILDMIHSWTVVDNALENLSDLLSWIMELNSTVVVDVDKVPLSECTPWVYNAESGIIQNKNGGFFEITGLSVKKNEKIIAEQPVILQQEIGYLGIICKKINGVLYFLMQAKIEPGNLNKVQISPTLQATKSNFTQKHGGRKPAYLDYFLNAKSHNIIVDQIQSEQSSRFYKKRNRNIIIEVTDDVEVLSTHKWITLGQLKQLMKYDNLVNMDTRTVLSCIPFCIEKISDDEKKIIQRYFKDQTLFVSMFEGSKRNILPNIYQYINNYKMFDNSIISLVPLSSLSKWVMTEDDFFCPSGHPFKIVFCNIHIEGREVITWTQPLFEAIGCATLGLICCEVDGVKMFLVHAKPEYGCFDKIEIGPSIQIEPGHNVDNDDSITKFFFKCRANKQAVVIDVLLSEEGGRFYHEQNYNVILNVDADLLPSLPDGYFLVDYRTLNYLSQINNCLNIQLRNLLSLLEL